ncbi:kinesin-like protein KIN-1 isoform X1 [Salvia miltiorrhiza]|uniref:kinesin-like protein KIN-1 isoform X1 n=1 Tax=Salvia miltiorrhiza TaxID=226208 RepID=UPI0025ABBCE4|nr:kinesin-like protein KIN-1 isoform X1 [Salvia miltiorrhiza]XP_057807833.1 kinesin-like protein KIN-1 isoform X1 [Salvia miltiorrhiza]XP_057807834.1 kinesin-like protein KIN-1 isoform X1 [Salvia miltiorrhiza]
MPSIRVCALFRPLSSKEKSDHGDSTSIHGIDSDSFVFKDEKEEETEFHFDKVFFQGSEQADIYEFLALPIVKGVASGVNGAIITYGQTGAGKTYSMEGPNIIDCDEKRKGLLPRVVDGIFNAIKPSDDKIKSTIKLSMVEIYMERVRDLFDLSKDNLLIKENKLQGIFVNGVTEISISDSVEALRTLSTGIANRAVGETQMNMASSRSHCIYIFVIQQEIKKERRYGKLILVDLAGSEKAERTGAEGRVLEEAKTINKSLSALGNVINALSSPGKGNHIPYRDSKLTRILQDALGGNSQTALLCCCSPSPSNASETLSTLRFGARAKHIKQSAHVSVKEDEDTSIPADVSSTQNESSERILSKLAERLEPEDVQLLEQLFILEGIFFNPNSVEEVESAYEDVTSRTISSLQKAVEELVTAVDELKKENEILKGLIKAC